jgi:hypothetical protein
MEKAKQIGTKVAAILAIANEAEVLAQLRKYFESLTHEDCQYAYEYAHDFLAKRAAAVEEALREADR